MRGEGFEPTNSFETALSRPESPRPRDVLHDGPGGNAVLLVVLHLEVPAAVDLFHGPVNGAGHNIGVEDDVGVDVPGGPADDLDEGALVPEEPLLVGVQDADELHPRDVESPRRRLIPTRTSNFRMSQKTQNEGLKR